MSDVVLAAVIGGIFLLITTIISLIWGQSQKKRSQELQQKSEDLARQAQEVSKSVRKEELKRYGFQVDTISSEVSIRDVEGNHTLQRKWEGLKIISSAIHFSYIPCSLWIGSPNGEFTKYPELVDKTHGFPKQVSVRYKVRETKRCEFDLTISPDLSRDDPDLDATIEAECSRAFLMKRAEVLEAYGQSLFNQEFHSLDVEFPANQLLLRVIFPQEFEVEIFPVVFFGKSDIAHDLELQRVIAGFQTIPTGAELKVSEPLVGFRYAISWLPIR